MKLDKCLSNVSVSRSEELSAKKKRSVPIIMLKYIRQNKVAIPLPDYFNPEARPN
jgi:hypothetical protein